MDGMNHNDPVAAWANRATKLRLHQTIYWKSFDTVRHPSIPAMAIHTDRIIALYSTSSHAFTREAWLQQLVADTATSMECYLIIRFAYRLLDHISHAYSWQECLMQTLLGPACWYSSMSTKAFKRCHWHHVAIFDGVAPNADARRRIISSATRRCDDDRDKDDSNHSLLSLHWILYSCLPKKQIRKGYIERKMMNRKRILAALIATAAPLACLAFTSVPVHK